MNRQKSFLKSEKFFFILFIIMAAVGIFIYLPSCYDKIITYDSSYQYGLTRQSWSEIWRLLPEDYSPPLYTVILKISCMIFGHTLKVMRFTNSIVIFGLVFLALFPIRRGFGAKTGIVAAVCFICSTVNMQLFSEIRPTYLAYFFVTGTAVYAYLAFFGGKRKDYICHAVFSLLAMYTHNIGMIIILGIYVTVLLFSLIQKDKKKFFRFFISGAVCAVLYLPWLVVVLKQFENVKKNYWKGIPSTFSSLIAYCIKSILHINSFSSSSLFAVFIDETLSILIKLLIIFFILKNLGLKKIKKVSDLKNAPLFSKENRALYFKGLFVLMLFLVPLIIFEVLTRTVYPLSTQRYYFMFTGIVILIIVSVMNRIEGKIIPFVLSALLIANTVLIHYRAYDLYSLSTADKIIETIERDDPDGKICFIHSHEWTLGVMSYYYPEAKHFVFDDTWTVLNDMSVFGIELEHISVPEAIAEYTDHFYIFCPYFSEESDLQEYFEDSPDFECQKVKGFWNYFSTPKYIKLIRVDVKK